MSTDPCKMLVCSRSEVGTSVMRLGLGSGARLSEHLVALPSKRCARLSHRSWLQRTATPRTPQAHAARCCFRRYARLLCRERGEDGVGYGGEAHRGSDAGVGQPDPERRAGPTSGETSKPRNLETSAERFVRTVRTECLDHLLILGGRHLERVLRIYTQHYTSERPHRGLGLQPPEPLRLKSPPGGDVERRDRLGRLLHEYYRAAA